MEQINNAKLLLQEFNGHILVMGKTGSGKSNILHEANIQDAKYFDFVEITRDFPLEPTSSLTELNFDGINLICNFLDASERTLILDSVEIAYNHNDSKIIRLIKVARKYGKRLIVVAYPYDAEKMKDHFGAVITMFRHDGTVSCDIEVLHDM
jgi:ABC-type lipoprotein export system ATPase subunit